MILIRRRWRLRYKKISKARSQYSLHTRLGGLFALLILVMVYVLVTPSEATVAVFYPQTCLGGWENVEHAQGQPQVQDGDPLKYTDTNSAVLRNRVSELYCGGFAGSIPDNGEKKNVRLKFSWVSKTKDAIQIPESTSTDPQEDFTQSIIPDSVPVASSTPSEASISTSTTPTSTTTPETSSPEITPEPSLETPTETQTPVAPEAVPEPVPTPPTDTPAVTPPASEPESVPPPATPSEPQPQPTADASPITKILTVSNNLSNALASLFASPIVSAEINATNTSTSTLPAELPVSSEPTMFDILYTTDGVAWNKAGAVSGDKLSDAIFDIPLSAIPTWSDLSKIQIKVKSTETIDEETTIYLDSMWLEIEYQDQKEETLSEEELSKLPRVKVDSSKFFKSFKKSFKADENVEVELIPVEVENESSDNGIATTTTTTATSTPEASTATSTIEIQPLLIPEPETEQATTTATTSPVSYMVSSEVALFRFPNVYAAGMSEPKVVKAKIYDENGTEAEVTPIITTTSNGSLKVGFEKNGKSFRPGKYHIDFEILQDNVIYESSEEFTWGVLAVNLNKSIFTKDESAYVQMAALTDEGHTLCDANLKLTLTSPDLIQTVFSTSDNTIKKSNECGYDNVTNEPDYYIHQLVDKVGTYRITLLNQSNGYSIDDTFEVKDAVPFEVSRRGATRINPQKAQYTMNMIVKANEAFKGSITETVPKDFIIQPSPDYEVHELDDRKVIVWQKTLAVGEKTAIQYTYKAPLISPQFYLLGPLVLSESTQWYKKMVGGADKISFIEAREWQIASDAVTSYKPAATLTSNSGCTEPSGGNFTNDNPPTVLGTHLWQCDSDASPDVEDYIQVSGYDFQLASTSVQIDGIVVHLNDVSVTSSGAGTQDLKVRLSWDGGTSWTSSAQNDATTCTTGDITSTALDGAEYYCSDVSTTAATSDPASGGLWGRTWTASELSSTNFVVQVTSDNTSNTARVQTFDIAEVKVYYTVMPSISSAANQTFTVGDSATAISQITVTDTPGTITSTNDIRITLPSFMKWDTTDTTATIGGTASAKVSTTVSYENSGATLVLNVTSNLTAGQTVTVSGLSYTSFSTAGSGNIKLYGGGAADTTADATDDKTVSVKGSGTLANHAVGQTINRFESGVTSTTTSFYNFKITNSGENASTTLRLDLTSVSGIATGDITNSSLYWDIDSNGLIAASTTIANTAFPAFSQIRSMTIDPVNSVLYMGVTSGDVYRCPILTNDCKLNASWTTGLATANSDVRAMGYDSVNGVLYAAMYNGGFVYRCATSTACDADADWSLVFDSTETIPRAFAFDETNQIMYYTVDTTLYRCDTTTGCDASGEWVSIYNTGETSALGLTIDPVNKALFLGTGTGNIYRCLLSSNCDASSDFTLVYALGAFINTMQYDPYTRALYIGDEATNEMYRCAISTGCDASGDFGAIAFNLRTRTSAFTPTPVYLYAGSSGGDLYYCAVTTNCEDGSDWSVISNFGDEGYAGVFDAARGYAYFGHGGSNLGYTFIGDPNLGTLTPSISGATGTMSLTATTTMYSGATNLLWYGTISNLLGGDTMTVSLSTSKIISYGGTSLSQFTISGSATNITHTVVAATLDSAANQTFYVGQTATAISQITITDPGPSITATNDIRISIATSTHAMLWDTTDTSATIGGTASGKVSSTVSYEGGGSVLVLNVTTNFAASDTLTISGLSFKDFTSAAPASIDILKLYLGGASDTSVDSADSKTIAITGAITLANHDAGQVIDKFQNGETSTSTAFYAFKLNPGNETASTT
ncbi:MAG: hypothetical protein K0S38_607, partial [Candidatus Paceibacter sp.]|nr:hypothetical protein [Candidatus Paceibacter sp.]